MFVLLGFAPQEAAQNAARVKGMRDRFIWVSSVDGFDGYDGKDRPSEA